MNKSLIIKSRVAQRLAQIALFEKIQAMFNLHPQKMASVIREQVLAKDYKLSPSEFCQCCHLVFSDLFTATLEDAISLLEGKLVKRRADPKTFEDIDIAGVRRFFNLFPQKIAAEIRSRSEAQDIDPVETAKFLLTVIEGVVEKTFDETRRILASEE